MTFIKGELTLELLTTEDEEPDTTGGKRNRRNKKKDQSSKMTSLLKWTIDWMPLSWYNKIMRTFTGIEDDADLD